MKKLTNFQAWCDSVFADALDLVPKNVLRLRSIIAADDSYREVREWCELKSLLQRDIKEYRTEVVALAKVDDARMLITAHRMWDAYKYWQWQRSQSVMNHGLSVAEMWNEELPLRVQRLVAREVAA